MRGNRTTIGAGKTTAPVSNLVPRHSSLPALLMAYARLLALTCLLTMGLPLSSLAAPSPAQSDSTTLTTDSARVAVRRPPDTLLARFRADPAFNYDQTRGWTWWRDLRRWAQAQLASLFGRGTTGGHALQFAFYLFLALLVGYAAYMLVQLRSEARPPGRTAPASVSHPQTAEEMRAFDFDTRLEAAVADGQHRRAVRLLYQKTLQHLDRTGAITWRPGKTNRAYVDEIDADARPAFASLTRLFERVWYGGASVGPTRFEDVRAQFDAFLERVPASKYDDAGANASSNRDNPSAPSSSA